VLVVAVNRYIQVPDAAEQQLHAAIEKLPKDWRADPRNIVLPGYDGITGTPDDFVQHLKDGTPTSLDIPGQATFEQAAAAIQELAKRNGDKFPEEADARKVLAPFRDLWNGSIHYQILNSQRVRLISEGPEKKLNNPWNTGVTIDLSLPEPPAPPSWTDRLRPNESWLQLRKKQLGIAIAAPGEITRATYATTPFSGGQNRLEGAAYFQFFTWLILGTAVLYIPFALIYRPKTYLHE